MSVVQSRHSLYMVRQNQLQPAHLRESLVATPDDEPGAVGVEVSYPWQASSVFRSAAFEAVDVRGPFETGIRLVHCWNARLRDVFVNGPLSDEKEYADPQQMRVGIDLPGAMDCHVYAPCVSVAGVGIRASTHPDGYPRSEGLHVHDGFLMHVNTAVELRGSSLGGWPTPFVTLAGGHYAYNRFGVDARTQSWLNIVGVNIYASAYRRGQWGIYLVGCREVQISGCQFWSNWPPGDPGFLGGIVLDDCHDVTVGDCGFVDDIDIALHATARCTRVRTNGKVWDELARQGKVVNKADNR